MDYVSKKIIRHKAGLLNLPEEPGKCIADNTVFKNRGSGLVEQIRQGGLPTYIVIDLKGYTEKNSENLKKPCFITRVTNIFGLTGKIIEQALIFHQCQNQILRSLFG